MLDKAIASRKFAIRGASLCDQLFFSAANFILTILLARHYPEYCLAGYGVGLSIALILQGLQRTSYIVQNSVLRPAILRRRAGKVLGQQLLVWGGLCAGQLLIFWAASLIWAADGYFLAIASSTIVCTLIYIQLDFDRIVLIKHERFAQPLAASLIFLALSIALFFLAPRYGIGYPALMGIVALFCLLKCLWLMISVGRPDFFGGWRLLKRDFGRNFTSSLLGVVGYAGFGSGPIFILSAAAPHTQTAAFGAMRGLTQPLMIVIRSMDVVDKNFFQSGQGSPESMRRSLLRLLAGYGGLSLLVLAALTAFGPLLVQFAYGEKYAAFSPLLIGWGIIMAMFAVTYPLETVIVRLGKLRQYNACRVPAGLAGIAFAAVLCAPLGAWGAIIGVIAGWVVSIACALWLVREVLFPKKEKNTPDDFFIENKTGTA